MRVISLTRAVTQMTQVKIEVNIEHTDISALSKIDDDIAKAISKLVEKHVQSEKEGSSSDRPTPPEEGSVFEEDKWTEAKFTRLIKELELAYPIRSDIGCLFALLIAYAQGATNKPTTKELQYRCAPKIPDENGVVKRRTDLIEKDEWNEYLRTSKARITIIAKHMGLEKPFLSPYGQGEKRKHPVLPLLHEHLGRWIEGEIEAAKIEIDGENHYDSIKSLRSPSRFRESATG